MSTSLPAGALVDLERPVTISFEGKSIPALAGQSIAAALYAGGMRVFTRSFKYHRPRGLFCVAGECPNCLMHVDGRPNVRTCIEPARDGQVVRHQNAWPSLEWDALHIFDKLDRFLPVGFYYKRFHKPRWLWPVFEHVVRHIAGLGRVDVHHQVHEETEIEHLHTDLCVIGGGPAGSAAAMTAHKYGARVLVLERQARLGGHRLYDSADGKADTFMPPQLDPNIKVLVNTTAFGLYEENLIGAFTDNRLLKIRAKQVVVCTGSRQQPLLFHNNDLPGIFLGDGVLRLARFYGVPAGGRAVVVTDNDEGQQLAQHLLDLGMEVAAVVDARREVQPRSPDAPWPTFPSHIVVRALGKTHLKGVCIARREEKGEIGQRAPQTIACDLLCLVGTRQPANELLLQAGLRFQREGGRWTPDRQIPGLWAAGAAAGTFDREQQIQEAKPCGAEAAAALGHRVADLEERRRNWRERATEKGVVAQAGIFPQLDVRDRKRFVCLCEDVTEKDLHQAIAEGFDHIETLKRYTTVNMGPCQGKVCGLTASAICAHATGRQMNAVGATTSRPPAVPVEMAVLAAGQRHHPVRRTPMHHWHGAAGAVWMDAGQWKRPESYGDSVAEVRAVRSGVGLIDVSTLGKIEVSGPDAAALLERVYLNTWKDLKVGRVRYGAMCNEDGILIDDGVGARLAPDAFYLTATTGNAEAIVQWLELWKATWKLNATILNQTSAKAAVNLAGPRSREMLQGLADLDVSATAFPYLAVREGRVAGISCRLLRIGFVGELGYEIHCPSAHGQALWDALLEAGKPFGLRPFGVEAQRILRLEKGHLIIGQDTDALSNPLEAGLEWLVRLDKPDFIGRAPLLRLKAMGPRARLIGFEMADNVRLAPEGLQVVDEGQPVGRLTSTRYSPTLARSIGLAWVPVDKAALGSRFFFRWNGADVPAIVAPLPFYDAPGVRLRS